MLQMGHPNVRINISCGHFTLKHNNTRQFHCVFRLHKKLSKQLHVYTDSLNLSVNLI